MKPKEKEKFPKMSNLKDLFKDFERITQEKIPLQQKVDKLNIEMLKILKEKAN
jgi:hypothetical protein